MTHRMESRFNDGGREGRKEEGEREGGGRQGRRGEKGSIGLVGWRFIYNAERPGGSGGCVCVLGWGGTFVCFAVSVVVLLRAAAAPTSRHLAKLLITRPCSDQVTQTDSWTLCVGPLLAFWLALLGSVTIRVEHRQCWGATSC